MTHPALRPHIFASQEFRTFVVSGSKEDKTHRQTDRPMQPTQPSRGHSRAHPGGTHARTERRHIKPNINSIQIKSDQINSIQIKSIQNHAASPSRGVPGTVLYPVLTCGNIQGRFCTKKHVPVSKAMIATNRFPWLRMARVTSTREELRIIYYFLPPVTRTRHSTIEGRTDGRKDERSKEWCQHLSKGVLTAANRDTSTKKTSWC